MTSRDLAIMLVVSLFVVMIPLAGIALIWAINALFQLGIPYTWQTVLAAIILGSLFSSSAARGK